MKRELSEDMVNLIREQKADALMTQPTPPPRCRVLECRHAEASHFSCVVGSFCQECPTEDNIWEHVYDLERRVSGERRKQNTGCKWDRGFTTPHECNGPPENERTTDRRKAGKL